MCSLRSSCLTIVEFGPSRSSLFYGLTDSDVETFLKGEEKTKIRKEKPRFAYSVALVMPFLAVKNENRQLKDLPQADFGRVPERFLVSVRTKSIEFCTLKTRPNVCFYNDSRHVFISPTHFTIFVRGLSILLFSFINKVDFSSQ